MILPLKATGVSLLLVGGKGLNLARLAEAGFPVPDGFVVTTDAYRAFVAAHELGPFMAARRQADLSAPGELERVSAEIRARFSACPLPSDLADRLRAAYLALGSRAPVAVRSSATAEDLPDLSFAGQQDTYLNIIGAEALLAAVVNCWSSLWTARAIGYRARNAIPQQDVALAVIVQRMVASQASGVLFTANPLTGLREETVIDATLGLGEALVSGQVTPDHYRVDTARGVISHRALGSKAVVIRGRAEGGVVVESAESAHQQAALPDDQIVALARLGQRVARFYDGAPQDIEWAWTPAEGFHLLQARPITSLYPAPTAREGDPALRVLFSFGAVQGMLDPMTPLGQDVIRVIFAGAAVGLFHTESTPQSQRVIQAAGERLWVDVSDLLRHPLGRRLAVTLLPMVEPSSAEAIRPLLDDPRLTPRPGWFKFSTAWRVARFAVPVLARLAQAWLGPDRARARFQGQMARFSAEFQPRAAETGHLTDALALTQDVAAQAFSRLLPYFVPVFGAGMGSLNLLRVLSNGLPPGAPNYLLLTRGLPHNVTTEMDLALWQTARAIQADPPALAALAEQSASALAQAYLAGHLPPVAQEALAAFLTRYGRRGLGEIDIGLPRWREDPTPVLQALQSYGRITDLARAPDRVFERGSAEAESTTAALVAALRRTRFGRFKARLARAAARRVRAVTGLRESPKFLMVSLLDLARRALLRAGHELAEQGAVAQADDLFFLHLEELAALAAGESRDWRGLVAARRQNYAREQRRRQIPRVLLSDGRACYTGVSADAPSADGIIVGTPVSPGIVEGVVRVVLSPHGAQLQPGEIMVCPGTDPSWTPLFLAAGGLVMEVGGLMTHGSVVAREYGIPAVVGVDQATTRLRTGRRVRVDGALGRIEWLDEAPAP